MVSGAISEILDCYNVREQDDLSSDDECQYIAKF